MRLGRRISSQLMKGQSWICMFGMAGVQQSENRRVWCYFRIVFLLVSDLSVSLVRLSDGGDFATARLEDGREGHWM